MTTQRTRTTRLLRLAVLTMASFGLASCSPDTTEPEPSRSPALTSPFPVAVIGALTPVEAVSGDATAFEEHPAVQEVRTNGVVLTWANLVDSNEFAQFAQRVDPESKPSVIGLDARSPGYSWAPIGPTPFEVRSVTENPDGSTTVLTCRGGRAEVSKAEGVPRLDALVIDGLVEITVSPVTPEEVAELAELGLDAPEMRVRGYERLFNLPDCEATGAVVQEFVNWREVAPIGHYRER